MGNLHALGGLASSSITNIIPVESNMKIRDAVLLFISGLLVFVLTVGVIIKEENTDWKKYQKQFTQLVSKKLGPDVAASLESGLYQIWVPQLKVTDRCQTCHMGIEIPGLENEKQPFATHPDLPFYKKTHPFKDYGCTTCHDGQGYATKTKDAHGEVHHWMTPMYTTKIATDYGFENTKPMIQINCNQCHRGDRETKDMPNINLAKKLIEVNNCTLCHTINGQGHTIGPEITHEGSKYPEGFVFNEVDGKKSVLNWHDQHFKNPQKVSKDSLMINFVFNDEDAKALSLLMMSWKKKNIPVEYIPNPYRSDSTKPKQIELAEFSEEDFDGKTLYKKKFCITCHGDEGRSTTGAYPSLAGQTFGYLIDQIKDIKSGARKARNAIVMKPHVQNLTDDEITLISKYLTDEK